MRFKHVVVYGKLYSTKGITRSAQELKALSIRLKLDIKRIVEKSRSRSRPMISSKMEVKEKSQIQEFYNGQTILLTGATGFIGKSLLEKLLRTCTGVEKIYVIVRPKRKQSIENRMKAVFNNWLFDTVRKDNPDFAKKVIPISGDLALPDLGLKPEDRRLLIENTTIIIHNAATVYFMIRISAILRINALGTQKMLELAGECPRLKAFMYVSTGFSQMEHKYIEERCYPPPADLKVVCDIIAADDISKDGIPPDLMEQLRSPCPNNYIFSKAIAEGLVEKYSKTARFPCAIFRPTIVGPTCREPAFWGDNLNGSGTLITAAGLGLLHVIIAKNDLRFDMIPADMTTNALLIGIWDTAVHIKPGEQCSVYHYSINQVNPCTLQKMWQYLSKAIKISPSVTTLWYPFLIYTDNFFIFYVLHYFFHVLPCIFFDIFLIIRRKRPFAVSKVISVSKNIKAVLPFLMNEWDLEMKKIMNLRNRLNATDKALFFSDLREMDWQKYMLANYNFGKYFLYKETDATREAGKRRLKILQAIHYTLMGVFGLFFMYLLYKIIFQVFHL